MRKTRSYARRPSTSGGPPERTGSAPRPQDEAAAVSESAWRLLSYRARSRQELRARLLRKGHPQELVEAQLDRLVELGYINDETFARSLVASRQAGSSPRGAAALQFELRRMGVAKEIVTAAVAAGDDSEAAQRVALKRAGALALLDYHEFSRRMLGFLQRRGFGYDVARTAMEQAWRDRNGAPPEAFDLC
jgi:regulatory protein